VAFVESLFDVTDALCIEIPSGSIRGTNAIARPGGDGTRGLVLVPARRSTLITGLVGSVREDALFCESSRPLCSQHVFENFALFTNLYSTLLTDPDTRAGVGTSS
jgi:hypothetical protein